MDNKILLKEQIKVVIDLIEKDYANKINDGVLQLIYKRYKDALAIIENHEDNSGIKIAGGVRAYLDSYNDYQNSLVEEMHKAEKIVKQLNRGDNK
ncbi:hypothetical protein M3689_17935 [Alkalihalophilus marmarensis]|uniref:Uncharacterized protein n=1 Tax=Alkalihalophilus marmarensis DSM 21297 TaxID=1188261 RepID=U6SRE9_9BACI|nr:hypothetical protein [Alkalihalophilus marmarensis]ERN53927.1 hypothetical protein A33I_09370 [Alkalihalophilus marmarensis DSM 21297]MCM3491184.1 hypothetical protein [Alkalihalophilus marmarensis]